MLAVNRQKPKQHSKLQDFHPFKIDTKSAGGFGLGAMKGIITGGNHSFTKTE